MARLYVKPSYGNYVRNHKTWFAGEVADKERYICRHCNTCIAVTQGSVLPVCHNCNGRRFTPL